MKIGDLIKYYFKNFKLVFIIIIIFSVIGCLVVYKLNIQYYSEAKFILGICSGDTCAEEKYIDYDMNENVIDNYLVLVKSDKVIEKAIEIANVNYEIDDVKKMIKTIHNSENHLVTIQVISKDSESSTKLASALYDSLNEEANRIFNLNNIHLIYKDSSSHVLVSKKMMYIYAVIISIMISIGVITVKYIITFNNKRFG